MHELQELLREQRTLLSALQSTTRRMKERAEECPIKKGPTIERLLLLTMAEGLIASHKAARIDDDGQTLDLIEDALRHVGKRLAGETCDGQRFSRKRLGSL